MQLSIGKTTTLYKIGYSNESIQSNLHNHGISKEEN